MFESKNPGLAKRSLTYWEEAIGPLNRVWKENGSLKAKIGKIILILPPELEETLEPLMGQRISILRTDIPKREYLFRVLPNSAEQETEPMTAQDLCEDDRISNCGEVS